MPKKGKNKGKAGSRHRSASYSGDVTLNDFANNNENRPGPSRINKTNSNSILMEEKRIAKEELDWFDKSFDDSDDDNEEHPNVTENEEQLKVSVVSRKKKESKALVVANYQGNDGIVYPPDLWYVLSDYIQPSEAGRFAALCKFSYQVTKTSRFWIRLYKSYSRPLAALPLRLQPHLITCKMQGLRSSVIRSLFYLYEPFVEKHRLNQEQKEPHCLIKRKCVSTWHQKGKVMYNYFFKMEDQFESDQQIPMDSRFQKTELTHFTRYVGDIYANSEKRFRVLQVTSKQFIAIPPTILGHTLLSVSSSLSTDFRSHILRLIFGPAHTLQYYPKGKLAFSIIPDGSTGIILNNVVMTKVLDWWSPNYPCSFAEESAVAAAYCYRKVGNAPRHDQQQQEERVDLYF